MEMAEAKIYREGINMNSARTVSEASSSEPGKNLVTF